MEPFEHLKTDSVVELQVSVANIDVSTSEEIVDEQQADLRAVKARDLGIADARRWGCPKVAWLVLTSIPSGSWERPGRQTLPASGGVHIRIRSGS